MMSMLDNRILMIDSILKEVKVYIFFVLFHFFKIDCNFRGFREQIK